MTEEVTILKKDMTKQEVESWVNSKNTKKTVDQESFGTNDMRKINDWIRKAIENNVKDDNDSHNSTNNDHNDKDNSDDSGNSSATSTNNSKKDHIRTVEIHYKGATTSTIWKVDFDMYKYQRLDQRGFSELLMKIVGNHVIFDADRQIFWIYDSKRWVPLKSKGEDLRQFAIQAVDIFIDNTMCQNADIVYDPEQAFYLKMPRPVQDPKESKENFIARMQLYKEKLSIVKRYNRFLDFIQRGTVIDQAFKDLKALKAKSNIDWDSDDYLLNVSNGVVNLKTGELIDHDQNLYLTRIAPVDYQPKAKHPVLDRVLSISFPNDEELQQYMQKEAGYFTVGGNRDEHLFLWFGPSARNGKSVLANTIGRVLGSELKDGSGYAKTTPVETFLSSRFGDDGKTADPNLAGLQGVRLAIASEPDRNAKLASGKVKAITGDRIITARFLHQDPSAFAAKFKILISCNFLPQSDGDASIKRRMNITPFEHHIKEGSLEDDPFVLDKLWDEREGILSWMIEGAMMNEKTRKQQIAKKKSLLDSIKSEGKSLEDVDEELYEDPLFPLPKSIIEAIDKYIYSANSVSQFLHESVISKHDYWKYLVHNLFKKFDFSDYSIAYGNSNRSNEDKKSFDSRYFKEQKLLCLPNAYILRSDLYKLYQNYCDNNGINRPVSAHAFYDMASRYLVPARLHEGRAYLGITATPAPGNENSHDWTVYKHWVSSPHDFKERIYKTAMMAQNAMRNNDVDSLKTAYHRVCLNDKDTITKQQTLKLAKSVKINPDLYFKKMIGTLDSSDIDFERELDEIHGGVNLTDESNESLDDKKLEEIFG